MSLVMTSDRARFLEIHQRGVRGASIVNENLQPSRDARTAEQEADNALCYLRKHQIVEP